MENAVSRMKTWLEDGTMHRGSSNTTGSTCLSQYVTLSYCWGKSTDVLKTRKDNIRRLQDAIPLESLPTTCSEAVCLTRLLGLWLLWIDALCIIQDDEEGRQVKASKMCEVYRHSYMTLVSLATESSDQSFLRPFEQPKIQLSFDSSLSPRIQGTLWLRHIPAAQGPCLKQEGSDVSYLLYDFNGSLWQQRGWTFQENQCSYLAICFGSGMMHFRCRTNVSSEDGFFHSHF